MLHSLCKDHHIDGEQRVCCYICCHNPCIFQRFPLQDDLYIENEALQEVIEGLNQSKDNSYRYDFSIIESDVLGNIYEQYLGNILKSTPKRAKLEESKTHRKEQGIYYTPSYIVDYIVKNTVGEYIKTHTPEEIRKVRIVDPACGSGSFLIRAYRELENYWKQNSDFAQLTLDSEEFYSKKVEILKNNIFGVDLRILPRYCSYMFPRTSDSMMEKSYL